MYIYNLLLFSTVNIQMSFTKSLQTNNTHNVFQTDVYYIYSDIM